VAGSGRCLSPCDPAEVIVLLGEERALVTIFCGFFHGTVQRVFHGPCNNFLCNFVVYWESRTLQLIVNPYA
jgi:hypothetical protein